MSGPRRSWGWLGVMPLNLHCVRLGREMTRWVGDGSIFVKFRLMASCQDGWMGQTRCGRRWKKRKLDWRAHSTLFSNGRTSC